MKIVICGLTITSSWGNGHATTYRSLVKALTRKGHKVLFIEKDVEWYRSNRDLPEPGFCSVRLYDRWNVDSILALCSDADVIVIGSYFPDAIELSRRLFDAGRLPVFFYDIDTPITVAKLRKDGRTDYLDASLIPEYAAYLSFTGGAVLDELKKEFRAVSALPFYCSVDPELYRPTEKRRKYCCDLSYLGTYAPDRQPKLMELLDGAARRLPERKFIVAGPQYPKEIRWRGNIGRIVHLAPPEHPSFYSSSRFSLNLTRGDMVAAGYSPSVRLFEASACGAAILSDAWTGLEEFLAPGEEVLIPRDGEEVAEMVEGISDEERIRIGSRARERILAQHTADHRAAQFEEIVARCSVVGV
jgi:spore maturation protein CgeB